VLKCYTLKQMYSRDITILIVLLLFDIVYYSSVRFIDPLSSLLVEILNFCFMKFKSHLNVVNGGKRHPDLSSPVAIGKCCTLNRTG